MLKSDYLLNLNEKQQEAVLHLDGPLLIVAGAGSGKTKVLTSRIAHIIRSHKAFSNQILEINNFYTDQNYFFSNAIDDNQSSSLFFKGNFFPEIKIEGSSKSIFSLLKSEANLICSSDFSPKQKINTILLANSYSKNHFDAKINDSSYELLNLDKCYYLVSPSGLITMVDLISNLNQKSPVASIKSKYSDPQQKTLDTFNVNKFKPSIPKFSLRFPFFQKNY